MSEEHESEAHEFESDLREMIARGQVVAVVGSGVSMGSTEGYDNEKPVHRVRLTHGFLLGKYPVTNVQYACFLEAAGKSVRQPTYWDDRRFNQPEQPVVGVSWDDARAYCEWAGARLPTEAEWEYACRAGTTTEYSFGDDPKLLEEYAWFEGNSGGQTQPVGAKKPNPWGLHDMHGNVWEWCEDWYGADYYGQFAGKTAVDPTGPTRGAYRVSRGGRWSRRPTNCRSAYRNGFTPGRRSNYLGFRPARSSVMSGTSAFPG